MSLVQFRPEAYADLAHLVERNLAKVEVAGPSPVIRLKTVTEKSRLFLYPLQGMRKETLRVSKSLYPVTHGRRGGGTPSRGRLLSRSESYAPPPRVPLGRGA